MLSNIYYFLQILNTIWKWIVSLIKHYRIIFGTILFFNVISLVSNPVTHFPWFTFFIIIYFIISFVIKHKQKHTTLENIPAIHIENNNFIHLGKNGNNTIHDQRIRK